MKIEHSVAYNRYILIQELLELLLKSLQWYTSMLYYTYLLVKVAV
jgi:hypothetical protein